MKPKRQSEELSAFRGVLRQVLSVSKTELNRRLAEEKAANAGKPKRGPKPRSSASDHASGDKG